MLVLGMDAKLYYNTSGAGGGGSWIELSNAKDVTLSVEKGEADVTVRANNGWEAMKGTLKKAVIECGMVWDTEDPGFTALRNAFFNNTAIGIRCLDRENGEGLQADMDVTQFSRNEQLTEAISVDVTLKPTYSTTAPSWVTP